MTELFLLRHGATAWNADRRLQGRTDEPLSPAGRAEIATWRLPAMTRGARLVSSPLARAVETARILSGPDGAEPQTDARLVEMDFGAWEGQRLEDLRARDPDGMARIEAGGWDMTPPGGESPRAVWARVQPLLREMAADGRPVLAVAHKGVIRAILARAWGWDFLGKPPARLLSGRLHRLRLRPDGEPEIVALNLPLARATPPRLAFHVQSLLGIGHLARAAAIARAAADHGIDVHVLSGGLASEAADFGPATVHPLPPVRALDAGFKTLVDADGTQIDDAWIARRGERTLALLRELEPDALLLEGFPLARRRFGPELLPALSWARARGIATATSLRDIPQPPGKPSRADEAITRAGDWIDRILVHGDPDFLAVTASWPGLAALQDSIVHTGFVASARSFAGATETGEIVVSAGGGAVGGALIRAAIGAARAGAGGADRRWRVLVGPHLPAEDQPSADDLPRNLSIEPNRPDFLAVLAGAALSISQAGYNTVMDLARAGPRAILCPFAGTGEVEQTLRADRLQALGRARVIGQDALSPDNLARAVEVSLAGPKPPPWPFRMDGAARTAHLLLEATG